MRHLVSDIIWKKREGKKSHQFWPTNDQVVTEDQFVHSGLDSVKFIKYIIYKI